MRIDENHFDDILIAGTQAINATVANKGRTAYQAVFGRVPRFPGDLLSDERALLAGYDANYADELRASAIRIIAEMRASSVIRRALLRKTATSRHEAQSILPGSMAAYWRWQKKAKGRKRGGYVLARLLHHDPDGKTSWLHNGSSVIQVAHEQLRPAFGLESWTPSSQDIAILKDGARRLQQGLWEDERGPAPNELTETIDPQVTTMREELILPLVETPPIVPATPAPAPSTPAPIPILKPSQSEGMQGAPVFSPTFRQKNVHIYNHYEAGALTTNAPNAQEDIGMSQPPDHPEAVTQGQSEALPDVSRDATAPEALPPVPDGTIPRGDDGQAESKHPRIGDASVLIAEFDKGSLDEIRQPPPGWDGRPLLAVPTPSNYFRVSAAQALEEPVSSDSSDDEMRKQPSDLAYLTRQERKAMDREIPWREIMKRDQETIDAFIAANKKEYDSWCAWGSIRPLSAAETDKLLAAPMMKGRIIPARNAYRDKNRGVPPLKPKCRTVILGCMDPDMKQLDRASPTPSRVSEAVVLQVASAGINRRVQRTGLSWKLWAGDVATAFLQGAPEKREKPIFMRAPRDGIQRLAGTFLPSVYEVTGNLYGFCNAPKTWSDHVSRTLLQKLRLRRYRLDHMCFFGTDEVGNLTILMIVHVDDFLVCVREDYHMSSFLEAFKWGSQTELTESTPITFRGKEIHLLKEGELWIIKVTQQAFIKELSTGSVNKKRINDEAYPRLTEDEKKEYRSCAGSLQWLGSQTRPDVCSTVSLSNLGLETGPKELQVLYDCIQSVKATSDIGLIYYPVPVDRGMHLIGYGDSSWANAPGHKSQMGILVLATFPGCLDSTVRATIMDWKSTRSPRVTRSTLASEANAMDEAVDRTSFLNYYLTELLYSMDRGQFQMKLKQLQVTDCKSLFDALLSPNPALTEKRTIISVRSIQEYVAARDVRWTPTHVMWADGLTKYRPELLEEFRQWLRRPVATLVEEGEAPKKKDSSVNFEPSGAR